VGCKISCEEEKDIISNIINMFSHYGISEQRFETKFSLKTISIDGIWNFSYPINFMWLWNLETETKTIRKQNTAETKFMNRRASYGL
jgi:hypothetical protein